MSPSKNPYELLAQLDLRGQEEEKEEDELVGRDPNGDEIWKFEVTPFNIDDFEVKYDNWRIITREFLQQIAKNKELTETAVENKERRTIMHCPSQGEPESGERFCVVDTAEIEYGRAAEVGVRYLVRVELHRDFQQFRQNSLSVKLLRYYNDDPDDDVDWIPVPYVLNLVKHNNGESYKSVEHMVEWRNQLQQIKKL
ncbi:uncharacterized protein CC84DRAFT_1178414 [Paraphaeosphaeria sporulosa]|uniref:Uncharacterized protein n=1 Tax=Paraphaeosphaeria sporulosa TaxID=1460663 RepID=A0A177C7S5_9PLEO|nr:uncharacterized protein CC84DRAFT_1178414 [Paraphaeosphaeria sporulosa]OAG02828.1 hypothetical protein CC84DRAFT_1178414 [Paraphaeosphaeria sporulosa]